MTQSTEADRLVILRAFRPGGEAIPTCECLDDDTLAALAEGILEPETRDDALSHVAGCDRCRRIAASVARAIADPEVARAARAERFARGSRVRRFTAASLIVAAAAALVLLVLPSHVEESLPTHRTRPIAAAAPPEVLRPIGTVAEARTFSWGPVPGADRYRVSLFDAVGAVLYEAELTGTVLTLPDTVRAVPGETYWWKVDARLGFDRWVGSSLIEFSVEVVSPQ